MMKIVFFGSDDFAEVHLKALIEAPHEVLACVTPPDKGKGRGLKVGVSPVKARAIRHGIPVLQPVSLKEETFINSLRAAASDIFVVIAYGRLIPEEILQIPRQGALNVHGSLLPQYRGAAPINWAIINGERETGISIIKINPLIDAGDIISTAPIKIEEEDTAVTLRARMIQVGPPLLLRTLQSMARNDYALTPQSPRDVTFAPKLTKALGHIVWTQSARAIHNLARGLLPWPTAYTYYKGKLLKILSTEVIEEETSAPAGQIIAIHKKGIVTATGRFKLLIKRVHPESGKPMDAQSFGAGSRLGPGSVFDRTQ